MDRLVAHARTLREAVPQPITYSENYLPWTYKLEPLADELDFLSVHTYPAWEYRTLKDALAYTKQNYHSVVDHYPDKPVVITEAGWTTASNGRGIEPWKGSPDPLEPEKHWGWFTVERRPKLVMKDSCPELVAEAGFG